MCLKNNLTSLRPKAVKVRFYDGDVVKVVKARRWS